MISGTLNNRLEATISLDLRGSDERSISIDAVIDTGYTGMLTLPQAVVDVLKPRHLGDSRIFLADGSAYRFQIYRLDLLWDGEIIQVAASVLGNVPLIGMSLLMGYRLDMDIKVGGRVQLTENNY